MRKLEGWQRALRKVDEMSEQGGTPTPLTDALVKGFPDEPGLRELAAYYNKLLGHARTLERELSNAQHDITVLYGSLNNESAARLDAERDLATLREQLADAMLAARKGAEK